MKEYLPIILVLAIIVVILIAAARGSVMDCICDDPECGGGCNPNGVKRRP